MPEAEIRLGKDRCLILDLFGRKRRGKGRVQKSWDGTTHVEAALRPARTGQSLLPTRSMSSPPNTASSVLSAPDSPTHSRKETRHPPEIRNSQAAAAPGALTGDPAA